MQTELQPIGSEIELALSQLKSPPASYKSPEEAEEAWRLHKARTECGTRLLNAGYPRRAIANLATMHGPGMECARAMYPLIAKGSIIFLIGDRGPGKTQIGTWIASQRIMDGAGAGVYRKALDLWGEIRATWRQGSEKTEDDVERRYKRAEFLVVDEAQERGDTEGDRQWCDRMFTHILDHRYDGMLPTLLIANLNPEGYEATIPASIRSRVAECGGVKHCDWPSYRTA